MPEHHGFKLSPVEGRSVVQLRVRPNGATAAREALELPGHAGLWRTGDPAAAWLGPDQWLLTSDTRPAESLIGDIDHALSGQLHAALDMSSNYACFELSGPAARTVLAMGCGIDMHPDSFTTGQCVRTRFAKVLLLVVATSDTQFDLYIDRSHSRYFSDWLAGAHNDPMTHISNEE
jgi:sarcosine oxidase subunit gamma